MTFTEFDPALALKTQADIAYYLRECARDGDPDVMVAALDDVARARENMA